MTNVIQFPVGNTGMGRLVLSALLDADPLRIYPKGSAKVPPVYQRATELMTVELLQRSEWQLDSSAAVASVMQGSFPATDRPVRTDIDPFHWMSAIFVGERRRAGGEPSSNVEKARAHARSGRFFFNGENT